MITEAFTLRCGTENAYLHIDRTYKYDGIMLFADALEEVCVGGIDGCTYFEEFSLKKWISALGVSDTTITMEVTKDCDDMINRNICKEKLNDVLSIVVKNGTVIDIKNSKNETVYALGDDFIDEWKVGWLGKIYDYYTKAISYDIEDYDKDYYDSCIWGVYYSQL